MFKNKYRIIKALHRGYNVQIKYWTRPFTWRTIAYNQMFTTIEEAEEYITRHRQDVIKYID